MKQDSSYRILVSQIKEKIRDAQYQALKAVNKALIALYWEIGQMIVERQGSEGWGKSVVASISQDIQSEFPGLNGFSSANLWRMRSFYLTYNEHPKLAPLVREISWTKHILILAQCKDSLEREFYIRMTKKFGWTKAVLAHHIDGKSYEKYLLNQTNFDQTVPEKYRSQAKLALKDEYSFDFLEMGETHSERDLELGLLKNIRRFLMEMGGDFTFVGNQYRLEVEDEEFFIDLVLYHRRLKCLVAIELKTGKFKPEYAGKMQFYLSALNSQSKIEGENNAIGIIICKSKNRTVVEYALNDVNKPIGIAKYTIQTTLPDPFKKYLPTADEIVRKVALLES